MHGRSPLGRHARRAWAGEVSWLESCRVLVLVTPQAVVSHHTAALLHGLRIPRRFERLPAFHLSRPVGLQRPRRRHVIGHELLLDAEDVVDVAGVPATSVQRTLLDIAPDLGVDELVALADQIVCAHNYSFGRTVLPLVEIGYLRSYLARHAGARGMRKLQQAMALVRVGSDSTPETRLRLLLGRSPLPEFHCNHEIRDGAGTGRLGPDLACPQFRTCVEYDGGHHLTAEQQGRDHDRNFVTLSLGWQQAIINKHDMAGDGRPAITKIARMLVLGGWDDPLDLAGRSLLGRLGTRKDFA
ncbi:hypothetical protein [Arthrobacter sp. STN4]|uniref:hypothetical protein n=1 Tax=Arthrobacter sp. STN4 TaxID=2923276 RepID=UPI00211A9122|nr:hypothetical protein [Arthrobacter sp. STN4]MCQ9164941.1 hypothetical protein [Arthrobacter sp. STN4]